MLKMLLLAGSLLISTWAIAKPLTIPSKPDEGAKSYLRVVKERYINRAVEVTKTFGLITEPLPIYDAASGTVIFTASDGDQKSKMSAKALPIAFLDGAIWQWVKKEDGLNAEAANKARAWLTTYGWGSVAKPPITMVSADEARAYLALAAAENNAAYWFTASYKNGVVGIIMGGLWPAEDESTSSESNDVSPTAATPPPTTDSSPRNPSSPQDIAVTATNLEIDKIRGWLEIDEPMEIGESFDIKLSSGEKAILANASFPEQGRNIGNGVLLIRPSISQARIIEMNSISQVVELGSGSGVVSSSYSSGQGYSTGSNSLSVFESWDHVSVLTTAWTDNTGDCGAGTYNRTCQAEDVKWSFEKNNDELILVEIISKGTGTDPDNLEMVQTTNRYGLSTGKPIKL